MGLEILSRENRIERAYTGRLTESGEVQFVTKCFGEEGRDLRHTYSPRENGENSGEDTAKEAYNLMCEAQDGVDSWYKNVTGESLPRKGAPKTEVVPELRARFYEQKGFRQALEVLMGKDGFEILQARKVLPNQPWNNEIMTGEISFTEAPDSSYFTSHLVPMHSLEMQMNREGVVVPVRPVSTDGIVLAMPDGESETGYIVFGVRGGGGYPNTYHTVAAGGLEDTEDLRQGKKTIREAFISRELLPELGKELEGIDATKIIPIGRIEDWMLGMGSCTYTFKVQTGLSREQLKNSWGHARDKQEHTGLIFIPNNFEAVRNFITTYYRGFVENRTTRGDDERVLLHPGTMDLALYSENTPGFKPKGTRPILSEMKTLQEIHGKEKKVW